MAVSALFGQLKYALPPPSAPDGKHTLSQAFSNPWKESLIAIYMTAQLGESPDDVVVNIADIDTERIGA